MVNKTRILFNLKAVVVTKQNSSSSESFTLFFIELAEVDKEADHAVLLLKSCSIDATQQQIALNFELVVRNQLFK